MTGQRSTSELCTSICSTSSRCKQRGVGERKKAFSECRYDTSKHSKCDMSEKTNMCMQEAFKSEMVPVKDLMKRNKSFVNFNKYTNMRTPPAVKHYRAMCKKQMVDKALPYMLGQWDSGLQELSHWGEGNKDCLHLFSSCLAKWSSRDWVWYHFKTCDIGHDAGTGGERGLMAGRDGRGDGVGL